MKTLSPLILEDKYYLPNQYIEFFRKGGIFNTVKHKNLEYYNTPISFDIETTSTYLTQFNKSNQMDKVAIMYEWTLCINGVVMIGRTWKEFLLVCSKMIEWYNLTKDKRMIVYVHNLSFEFQFLRKLFEWSKVFSLDKRKPIQAVTEDGIEFRCSYLLSGYSLMNLSKQLTVYKFEKLMGDLDYSLIRHSETPLSKEELQYCINDTLVVVAYIWETINRLGGINKIPLTKTGYVRRYCRDMCLYEEDKKSHKKSSKKFHKYRELMKELTLDKETYLQLKRAFAGGFTHASAFYSGKTVENVGSFDFSSSYPYVMISEQFPMSKPEKIVIKSDDEFLRNLKLYCCLFDLEIFDLEATEIYENYISSSHCYDSEDIYENNGRVVTAKRVKITVTEQDFFIIERMYTWSNLKISNFRRFRKQYLPTDFVKSILKLYVDKTELKGVDGREVDYMQSKEKVNASYGMIVTDICRDEIVYEENWDNSEVDIEKSINSYNKSIRRFLYYPWGVWVTAYARKNLFTGIVEFNTDYIYSDTDSIKGMNIDKHMEYIEKYNRNVIRKLEKAMEYHNIPIEMTKPKNIKGEEKQIGIWEFENVYNRFKTLGAKRYMTDVNGDISLTVSGINKKKAIPYLLNEYGNEVFEHFEDGLTIPREYSGKMTHTYIDEEQNGLIVDYLGNRYIYKELSSVHLENVEYSLSLSERYVEFLLGIKEVKFN